MKKLGILGGCTWHSTMLYYETLNRRIHEELGGHHSANLVIRSIDYHEMKQYAYQNWDACGDILLDEFISLESTGVDGILLANNTLHKVYDNIAGNLYSQVPFLHIVDACGEAITHLAKKNILLLGTKFTMEDGFYQKRLQRFGISCLTPEIEERETVQKIIDTELGVGNLNPDSARYIQTMIQGKNGIEAVLMACTELPLLSKYIVVDIPMLSSVDIHVNKALEFMLNS